MKICVGPCGRTLPGTVEHFWRDPSARDGLRSRCTECAQELKRDKGAARHRQRQAHLDELRRLADQANTAAGADAIRAEGKPRIPGAPFRRWLAEHLAKHDIFVSYLDDNGVRVQVTEDMIPTFRWEILGECVYTGQRDKRGRRVKRYPREPKIEPQGTDWTLERVANDMHVAPRSLRRALICEDGGFYVEMDFADRCFCRADDPGAMLRLYPQLYEYIPTRPRSDQALRRVILEVLAGGLMTKSDIAIVVAEKSQRVGRVLDRLVSEGLVVMEPSARRGAMSARSYGLIQHAVGQTAEGALAA